MLHGPWYMVNQKCFHGVFYQHHALWSTKLENFNLERILIQKLWSYPMRKTPENIKMTLTDLKLTSNKPMIIKFQNRWNKYYYQMVVVWCTKVYLRGNRIPFVPCTLIYKLARRCNQGSKVNQTLLELLFYLWFYL